MHVRIPEGLHAALVAEAARQGVSLNNLVIALLAGAIGWRKEAHRGS
jgi:predicted HicB family RNase H-like nuclease